MLGCSENERVENILKMASNLIFNIGCPRS